MCALKVDMANIENYVGRELGVSSWMEINQSRINKFAEATGDFQWIHVDVERARTEMPGGKTIAHGYLILSLVPQFFEEIIEISGLRYGLNYGVNKVRFTSPVPVGSLVRGRMSLDKLEKRRDGTLLGHFGMVMERQGQERPVMISETLILLAPIDSDG
ncbi:MaoC family dehydratase [Luteithermobacter gelatinilyticus]|uniref:MaoC family dehydratase n=1 Tax=Luteithermobacter gelatinilyticus TaxID=2582913 RepID=UPI001AEF801B|nr:MaoC family dehydratase [Luteithermobacter gelatinilyticus]|tara:strand:+ start:175 stop:651 length:477 start_codon:yes stop_codon:yes gene_type:complete